MKWVLFSIPIALVVIGVVLWQKTSVRTESLFDGSGIGFSPVVTEPLADLSTVPLGSWLWKEPRDIGDAERAELIGFAADQGVKTLYLYVNDFGSSKVSETIRRIEAFIQAAHSRGIAVQALNGEPGWIDPGNGDEAFHFLNNVFAYNRVRFPEKRFDGVQFDIEPFGHSEIGGNETLFLNRFLGLSDRLVSRFVAEGELSARMSIGFAVPYWFDGENPKADISWKGSVTRGAVFPLIDLLRPTNRGYVALMDYRNQAIGSDGSIRHARDEIAYAESTLPLVGIVIGLEVTDVQPSKITFFGKGKTSLRIEMQTIADAFRHERTFAGFAIHTLDGFRSLRP